MFRRISSFFLLSLSSAFVVPALAEDFDPWLAELTLLLEERFEPEGRLELKWGRQRPAVFSHGPDAVLSVTMAPSQLSRQMIVKVRLTADDNTSTDHSLVLHASLWREGWALRAPSTLRSPLLPSMVEARSFDALRHRDVLTGELPAELDFARSLPADRLLTWRDVVRRPLVRRNEPVEVVASDGALTVTLRGIAMHDAARGESVRVRNPDSRREFTAIVSATAQAQVNF